jgi:ribonuclease E
MSERSDLATEAQTQPGGDAGQTETPNTTAAEPRNASRRGRRGGRGRGGSRARPARSEAEAPTAPDASPQAPPDTPPPSETEPAADRGGPGAGEPGGGATTTPSAARRGRRRGGRGRGGRGRSAASSRTTDDTGPQTPAGDPRADVDIEPAEPEPRPELAMLEAIADEDVLEAAEEAVEDAVTQAPDGGAAATGSSARRRRRRGGRGRGRGRSVTPGAGDSAADAAAPGRATDDAPATAVDGEPTAEEGSSIAKTTRRRATAATIRPAGTRPRRGRGTTKTSEADEGQEASATATSGPTRLRRGRSTSAGTRRRRESMPVVPRITDKVMVITQHGDRDQIAILEERSLVQHYVTRAGAKSMVGNVYLGRVQNVLPGMEAAFVDVGRGRNAVLYAGEVNYSPEDLEGRQPPRIEQVLKSGQSVLVQVTKDPIGGKGARLTAKISMPGRYLVLQPNWEITGISKRLDDAERRRLRALLKKIRPEGHGLIVRTAAEGASEEDLRADVDRLLSEWKAIDKKARRAKAPAVLYEEPELTVKVVRDLFTDEEYRELVTDSQRVYTLVTDYLAGVAPDLLPKVRLHTGRLPVLEEYHVVEQIQKGLDRKVWLPSGGYLVIDRTEAMTVIDVNTGKSVGKTNLEETVVNTNIEAAREVARQLRLRDIGGMIIIDFIDMLLEQNKRRVVDTLKEEMARDKTRSQVFDISPLGLLEVTRKRVSGGLLESFSETCPTCEGRGVILNYEP